MKYDATLPWRDIKREGFNDHIGPIRFAEVAEHDFRVALALDDRHMNSAGVCHGGVLMSVADTGMGTAAFTTAGSAVATIDFECDFLAAAKNGQLLHGVCSVARAAREFLFMEGDFYAGERRVLRASGIWVVRSRRQQQ